MAITGTFSTCTRRPFSDCAQAPPDPLRIGVLLYWVRTCVDTWLSKWLSGPAWMCVKASPHSVRRFAAPVKPARRPAIADQPQTRCAATHGAGNRLQRPRAIDGTAVAGRNRRDQRCLRQSHCLLNFIIRLREDVVIDEALTRNGAVREQQRFCYHAVCGKSCGRKKAETETGRKPLKRDITYQRADSSTARNNRSSANTARLEIGHASAVSFTSCPNSIVGQQKSSACVRWGWRSHGSGYGAQQ